MEKDKVDLPPVRVPAETKDRLTRVGLRVDRSVSYLIRLAVEEFLAREENREAAAMKYYAEFKTMVTELGGTVLETPVSNGTPVHIRCANGHDGYVIPAKVLQGQGICAACAGTHFAEAAFKAEVEELGGTVLESGGS
jgi:hypothetical protein